MAPKVRLCTSDQVFELQQHRYRHRATPTRAQRGTDRLRLRGACAPLSALVAVYVKWVADQHERHLPRHIFCLLLRLLSSTNCAIADGGQ